MCSGEGTYVPQFSDSDNTKTKQHKVGFDGWWCCTACKARGPDLNKKFCAAYTHKRWINADSAHTDHDSDGDYPGHK
eukprot:15288605-Heterocapsa_arctica.AAC.1